jgi:tetratricopeptide (TPR) repeat protein
MKKGSRTSLKGSERRSPNTFWRAFPKISANLYTVIVRLPWAIAIVVICIIVIQSLTQQTTVIKDISVPKTLAETGYTSDVAGHRMRDALYELKRKMRMTAKTPEVALAGDLPTIVVPTVGISLDAVVSSLRTLFPSTRSHTITGEVTINKGLLWLVLRMDGEKFHQSKVGVALEKPDDLFKAAAVDVMTKIKPYMAIASLRKEKKIEAALLMAERMLSRLPPRHEDIAWLHNLRALIYLYDLKDDLKAAEALKLALIANNNLSVVRINHGELLYRLGREKEATDEYLLAIKLDQTSPNLHLPLGNHYARQDKTDAAIAEYQTAIDLDPKEAVAHHLLGIAFATKNNFDAAIVEFQQAIDLDPTEMSAHVSLGFAFASKGNFDAAIPEYQTAIGIDFKSADAHKFLGHAFASKENFDAAIPEYQQAIDLDPKSAEAHHLLGVAFASKGNFDAAIPEYQKAIDLDPKSATAHYDLGLAFASKGNFDAAIPEYQKAIDLDPKDWAHRSLGLAFASKGNFDAAIPEYQKAIDLDPTDTANFDAAIAEYERKKAIDLDLTDARPRTNLGGVLKDATGD